MKKLLFRLTFVTLFMSLSVNVTAASTPVHGSLNDSIFGPNVFIFNPTNDPAEINNWLQQLYSNQRFNEFGDNRYAILFMPGEYGQWQNIDARVGYYTQILGLGRMPDDVLIHGAVRTQDAPPADPNHPDWGPGALTNFWRGCENLAIHPTLGSIGYPNNIGKDQNVWAVSQAAPLRRIHIKDGTLRLFEIGWSSGGFLADSKIDKQIISGSQQQWFTRNSIFNNWVDGNWNMVFTGSSGSLPDGTWPAVPYTVVDTTPVIREKPFLFFDQNTNQYAVMVPAIRRDAKDVDWDLPAEVIPIENFFIANPSSGTEAINAALQQGKHLLFTPGVYHLTDTIHVDRANTIILGIGFPSLVSDVGKPAMLLADVDGIELAGVMFDAGNNATSTLLKVGETSCSQSHADNPTVLFDVFCRVGGPPYSVTADACVTINSNDVIGDYFWLWRADHGNNVGWFVNKSDTGLIVNGKNVTIYGLMVEHFQNYQMVWNGDNGKVYFYQSEIPYDPPSQGQWNNNGSNGFASYKIGNHVNAHHAWGLGVYCYFRGADNIYLENAIEAPNGQNINLTHAVTIWLDGRHASGITHIVNGIGEAVSPGHRKSTIDTWPLKITPIANRKNWYVK